MKKTKEKSKKKLIASIALVVMLGIAAVVPLTLFMGNVAKAQTDVDSLFNIEIPCAYYNADVTYNVEINSIFDGSSRVINTYYRDGAVIAVQPSINQTVLDETIMARIELFKYTVYTDELELQTSYSYLSFNESAFGQYETSNGHMTSFIMKYWEENLLPKRGNGASFGGLNVDDPSESMAVWIAGNSDNCGYKTRLEKGHSNILNAIENVQTIYLDVRRAAYISLSVDGTLTIVEDSKLLQQVELTKTDDGFMSGDPAAVGREVYFGLQKIPYNGTSVPEEFWPVIWPDLFGE